MIDRGFCALAIKLQHVTVDQIIVRKHSQCVLRPPLSTVHIVCLGSPKARNVCLPRPTLGLQRYAHFAWTYLACTMAAYPLASASYVHGTSFFAYTLACQVSFLHWFPNTRGPTPLIHCLLSSLWFPCIGFPTPLRIQGLTLSPVLGLPTHDILRRRFLLVLKYGSSPSPIYDASLHTNRSFVSSATVLYWDSQYTTSFAAVSPIHDARSIFSFARVMSTPLFGRGCDNVLELNRLEYAEEIFSHPLSSTNPPSLSTI